MLDFSLPLQDGGLVTDVLYRTLVVHKLPLGFVPFLYELGTPLAEIFILLHNKPPVQDHHKTKDSSLTPYLVVD